MITLHFQVINKKLRVKFVDNEEIYASYLLK